MASSVVSRSVALPLPSSPHWAPSTTIRGHVLSSRRRRHRDRDRASGCNSTGALRPHATRSTARPSIAPGTSAVPSRVAAWTRSCSSPTSTPGAGARRALDVALGVLREDADVEVADTSNPGELDGVLHRAGCRAIVVAGGDGSLHAVVTALHRRHELAKRTLGLIPLGTGNDFARTLDIPLDPGEAAAALLERQAAADGPDRRRARRGRRQQRARRRERPGQPPRRPVEGAARPVRLRHPRLPDRGRHGRRPAAVRAAAHRGRRRGRSPTWTSTS